MPSASSVSSIVRVVVDFPFVPTTCTDAKASCGSPSSASRARIRSRPKPSVGQGESDSSQLTAEGIELSPVALELVALGLDDLGRRLAREAGVGEHLFAPLDLLLEACLLDVEVAV